jgi:hypothetical protein
MCIKLLEKIREKYHNGAKNLAAMAINIKPSCYHHYSSGYREVRTPFLIKLIKKYSVRFTPNGLTDKQIIDCLLEENKERVKKD